MRSPDPFIATPFIVTRTPVSFYLENLGASGPVTSYANGGVAYPDFYQIKLKEKNKDYD